MNKGAIFLLWDNFGPLHIDRLNAVTQRFAPARAVIGVEVCGANAVYDWSTGGVGAFEKHTFFPDTAFEQIGAWALFKHLRKLAKRHKGGHFVLCHWNHPGIFLAALWLRLSGRRVYTMGCSKFDDKPRNRLKELAKSLMFLPYHGALGSGMRSIGYFRFMGFRAHQVAGDYNTVSLDRIRAQAGFGPFEAHDPNEGPAMGQRDFLCVARLVPKKNLAMLLDAYAHYRKIAASPRGLEICGSGPLEQDLRQQARDLGLQDHVQFSGFVQSDEVSRRMARALALLLPSTEEQFGNVVPEAQAFGLPVIVSDTAGARDRLVRAAQNGFVVEPDNPNGLAWFMAQLSDQPALWQQLREGAFATAPLGDSARFAEGISQLIGDTKGPDQ